MKTTTVKETLNKGTIKLTITIPWPEVKTIYEKILEKEVKETTIPGFRQGKAPKNLVEKKINREAIYKKVLQEIIPQTYTEAIKKQDLKPIIQPKVRIISADEGKDWQFEIKTCEKPKVALGNYKERIKKAFAASKIWVPGKEEKEKKEEKGNKGKKVEIIFNMLLETAKINLPQILIDEEVERLLSNLLAQIDKLGLNLETYLNSIKKTIEQIKKEYQERAEKALKIEFILEAIADDLEIKINEKEIEEIKKKVKPPANVYYLILMLKKQKTIDKLLNL